MAELIGRRPLFPGRDYMHQLHLILDTLGTPSYQDTEYIASEKVCYVVSIVGCVYGGSAACSVLVVFLWCVHGCSLVGESHALVVCRVLLHM